MQLKNIADWTSSLGLLPMHLYYQNNKKAFIMLNGGSTDFCLDFSDEGIDSGNAFSDAWSTNTKNYVYVGSENTIVYNWHTENKISSIPNKIVAEKFDRFMQIVNSMSVKTEDDMVPFVMGVFRRLRNITLEKGEPREALNLLYKLLVSIEEDNYQQIDCKKWGIQDVNIPTGFERFVKNIKDGVNDIHPNLRLILSHCSGILFQEAHREVELFNYQLDLFSGISSKIKYKEPLLYSSVHYTPQFLARSIVENALLRIDIKKRNIRIFDPACGSGVFLIEALSQLNDLGYDGAVYVEGWDISNNATDTTKFLLSFQRNEIWKERLKFKIKKVEDSLQEQWSDDYDLILMNPPFASYDSIRDKKSKEAVLETLSNFGMKKRPNQAAAFLYKATTSLQQEGVLGIVLPSSVLIADQYDKLRVGISQEIQIAQVAHLGNYIFEDALTDASFMICKKDTSISEPQVIWCRNDKGVANEALQSLRKMQRIGEVTKNSENYSIYDPSKFPIKGKSWNVIPQKDERFYLHVENFVKADKLKRLGDIFTVHEGIVTGRKGLFNISSTEYEELPEMEKQYYRPLVSSGDIRDGVIMHENYIWYPYGKDGLLIQDEDELKGLTETWKKLSPYKEELSKRSTKGLWWEHAWPRTWQFVKEKHLYSQRFGDASCFGIGERNDYVIEDGNVFIFKNKNYSINDYYCYLALFSSSSFERLLSIYAKRIMKGYDMGNTQIKDIPIVDFLNERGTGYKTELIEVGKSLAKGLSYMKHKADELTASYYPVYEFN